MPHSLLVLVWRRLFKTVCKFLLWIVLVPNVFWCWCLWVGVRVVRRKSDNWRHSRSYIVVIPIVLWYGHVLPLSVNNTNTWWRHQMKTFFALLALCAGNLPVTGEFPSQRPVTRSFDVFFDLRLNKRLSKQSWGWWFQTPSWSFWHHCNVHRSLYEQLG